MSYKGNTSNNNEITEEGITSNNNNEIIEEVASSSIAIGTNINYEGTISNNNNNDMKEGTYSTNDSNDISEDDVTLFVAYNGEWEYDNKDWSFENSESSILVVPKCITLSEITAILHEQLKVNNELYHLILEVHYRTGSPWFPVTKIQNDKDLSVFITETSKTKLPLCVTRLAVWAELETREDCVTVFVEYDGERERDGEVWFFKDSKSSTIFVPKHVTLSDITDVLYEHLDVDKKLYRLQLEIGPKSKTYFFPEIYNNEDLSLFISETSKTKSSLCVTRILDSDALAELAEDKRKGTVSIFVAYGGKWEYIGEEWFFKDSIESMVLDVPKHITLSDMTNILNERLYVDKKLYRLKLEVHYRTGSPWFPITKIQKDRDLSRFISETSKTRIPLCVIELEEDVPKEIREDDTTKNKLLKAIRKNDWVKAREIVNSNTEEVTWTSKLNDEYITAFDLAVGEFQDNEVVQKIVNTLQSNQELLETSADCQAACVAAAYGNTEALKIILESNPKCLFSLESHDLVINLALEIPSIETFQYLFKQMQSYKGKEEFDTFLKSESALSLLGQVIDTGLIDVAYELINDNPGIATQVYRGITPLERIIRKPDLFNSGTHYNMYQRFVYRHVPIKNKSLGGTNTADEENQETSKKGDFVTKHTRRRLYEDVPLENKSFGSTNADEENQETPKKDDFVTKHTRRRFYDVIWRIYVKLWETTLLQIPHVKQLKHDKVKHKTTIKLLKRVCEEVDRTVTPSAICRLYSSPFCLAVEHNTVEAISVLTTYFANLFSSRKDGQNVYQLAVLNRSEKVYSYMLHHHGVARSYLTASKDVDSNNILHFAGRLAHIQKLNAASGAALQMQRELQWFEEVEKVVPLAHTRALNKNKETPMMVFRKEHKELRKDGEEWMKKTADSYTITAALIITIVFAAAITVPGGNDSATGKPIYETRASLIIFAISDAISLFTSVTSLLLFLSILTARYADEDFLEKLPKRLIYGLVMLFASVTSMMIAFSAALYIMFGQGKQWILIPVVGLAFLPIASFVRLQFPLLVELISSTYGSGMFAEEKNYRQSSANANKKKRA